MHKKVWFLSLIVTLGLFLAACGGGGNESATTSDASITTQTGGVETEESTPYTISGTVVDPDARGIPGVTITTSRWESVTTDEEGKWSFSDVSGTLSIYPRHADYTFDPESYHVEGPQTNFQLTAIPDGCPPTSPCKISDVHDLQNIQEDLAGHYVLVNDVDASDTKGWNKGEGFEPIGSRALPFVGSLDGDGFRIIGLHIDRPDDEYVALFGVIGRDGEIQNVGLVDGKVAGSRRVASLVAWSEGTIENAYNSNTVENYSDRDDAQTGGLVNRLVNGTLRNSYNTGTVTSKGPTVGGLVSQNIGSTIENSYNAGTVTSPYSYVGGIVAENSRGIIKHSYNTGNVSGSDTVGGIAASNGTDSYIGHSYNTGNITGTERNVGGVTGSNSGGTIEYSSNRGDVTTEYQLAGGVAGSNILGGTITYSYNTGNVKAGEGTAGGIVGENSSSRFGTDFNIISNSYSSGVIQGTTAIGGLVGLHHAGATIEHSYSTSSVRIIEGHWDVPYAGGLVGQFQTVRNTEYPDTIRASFYDTNYYAGGPDHVNHADQGFAKIEEELKIKDTFSDGGWDFDTIWMIDDGMDFPDLKENLRP